MTDTTTADVKDTTTTTADTTANTVAKTTTADTTTKTTADTTAADAKSTTILADKTTTDDTTKTTAPADWPADWRDKLAKDIKPGDNKFRERLDRFASPLEITRSWLAAEQKLSSGKDKPEGPPKDATAEQLTAWRKDNGVPEKPENYSVELPGGVKFDDTDKPIIDKFLKTAHDKNWTQQQVTESLQQFHAMKQERQTQVAAFDTEHKQKGEDALRAEFGADFRRNVAIANNFIATMPEELVANLAEARLTNGALLLNDPGFIRWAVQQGLEYPSLAPAGGEQAKGAETRLAEIRKFRQENPDKYDQDKAMQQEELQLLERQSKQGGRRAA